MSDDTANVLKNPPSGQKYLAKLGGQTREVDLFTTSTTFVDGLSPYSTYQVTIDGLRKEGQCGVVIPQSVNCRTRGNL